MPLKVIENTENKQNTYTTSTNNKESHINKGLEMVEGDSLTSIKAIPTYTTNLQGEDKLTSDDVERLTKMNDRFSHIIIGGKHKIISTKHCPINGMTASFEDVSQFYRYFENEKLIAKLNAGKAWLRWEGKAFFSQGVGFYPDETKCPQDVYNFFSGYAIKPKVGDCSIYLNHIKNCICSGDEVASHYLLQWLGHLVQKPQNKPSVAILLKSVEGTGKGLLVAPLLEIFGQFGIQVNGHENLTQRFNSVVSNKLVIFGDEVELRDKKVADKIKGLISEKTIQLERKGIEPETMPNYARFIFASNHVQVISAGLKERRYLVLEPVLQNKEYYQSIVDWLKQDGASYLFDYLLKLDIKGFNPNRAPITQALIDEKLCNLPPAMEFIYSRITGEPPFNGQQRIFSTQLVSDFENWLLDKGKPSQTEPARRSLIGNAMKNLGIESLGRSGRKGGIYYEIGDYNLLDIFNKFISE